MKRWKKVMVSLGILWSSFVSKLFAGGDISQIEGVALYGMPKPEETIWIEKVWEIGKFVIIPILFIVGTVVFIKKSSSNKQTKIITIIIMAILLIILCVIINDIILKIL